ncbi:adenosylcobinamide-phosphate synthase CbiB [soil metagenome]
MSIALAWLIDLYWGEPPVRLHPVVWMGSYLRVVRKRLPSTLLAGALAWLIGAALVLLSALFLNLLIKRVTSQLPIPPNLQSPMSNLLLAILLKPLFAWRALRSAGQTVLDAPGLPEAQRMLSWHLVSRDTSSLRAGEVYGATIESVTENLSDSLVAPFFYFVIGGLPLAALYRYVNTADALWGYRTPALERFGKVAARVDDLLNLIPARLTALLLLLACLPLRMDWQQALRIWRRDGLTTPSPNAGQPMSVAAGALGVRLGKRGVYDLGAEFCQPTHQDVARALRWTTMAAWLAAGLFSAFTLLRGL